MISIKGMDKAEVLQKLFNASKQQGLGLCRKDGARQMTLEEAQAEVAKGQLAFDYLKGRVLKVDLSGDEFCPALFDRDNREGSAADALK